MNKTFLKIVGPVKAVYSSPVAPKGIVLLNFVEYALAVLS